MHLIRAKYNTTDVWIVECSESGEETVGRCLLCNCFINSFKHLNELFVVCGKDKREVVTNKQKIKKLIDKLEEALDD